VRRTRTRPVQQDGTVVFHKDAQVLTVDPTHLSTATGPHRLSRADLAYEIASDVIGCWSE
jgi:hypothetical protein